jgi:hypothetical protein
LNGQCVVLGESGCPIGQDKCDGTCVELNTAENCGSCGNICSGADVCCHGTCADLSTSLTCGSCDNECPDNSSCTDGRCVVNGA